MYAIQVLLGPAFFVPPTVISLFRLGKLPSGRVETPQSSLKAKPLRGSRRRCVCVCVRARYCSILHKTAHVFQVVSGVCGSNPCGEGVGHSEEKTEGLGMAEEFSIGKSQK